MSQGQVAFPRAPLLAAAALLVVALAAAAFARLGGWTWSPPPAKPALAERELRFEDRPEGGVQVIDHRSNQGFASLAPGEDGFVRATLRGLARDRKRAGLDDRAPFVLAARVDGSLTLSDPATGRQVDLGAFGPSSVQAFARFIGPSGAADPSHAP
jgi:putative photosynthetic complex assembly protein